MEENAPITPESVAPPPDYQPPALSIPYPTGKREMIFCIAILLIGLAMTNSVLVGGFRLGFAVTAILSILCSVWYLTAAGHKGSWYTRTVLALCLLIAGAFGYSSDRFVKFVLFFFLLAGVNLALCLTAGQNLRHPGTLSSLLDAPRALFPFGFGKISPAARGIVDCFRNGSEASRRGGAILLGLAIAVPFLAIMIPLLMFADAAFEGLMDLLPEFDLAELFSTVFWGFFVFLVLYARSVALHHERRATAPRKQCKGLHLFTVNTVLISVCVLYLVYLISQLAYFFGGFSGILPQGYSTAQYARRGFFEMAWLCAINLGLITFGVSLVSRKTVPPLSTRLACLFLGLVTLFLVCSSCAKMVLYIGVYGLTRMRVLTMAIIVFLALTTVLVSVWLFVPRLQYMKAVMLIALTIGAGVIWMDMDTQVARYNVTAYLSGHLTDIDTAHLGFLGDGALPYVAQLTEAEDPTVAQIARDLLNYRYVDNSNDFRSWTYISHNAQNYSTFWEKVSPESEVYE